MKNPKIVVIAAAAGFFLSFFTALISGAGFGMALLRALVCAVLFAAASAGAGFAVNKFLSDSAGNAEGEQNSEKGDHMGGNVNIVLEDEALPSEPDEPVFDVRNIVANYAQTTDSEPQTAQPAPDAPPGESAAGQKEDLEEDDSPVFSPLRESDFNKTGLTGLPDIGELDSKKLSREDEVIKDMDFVPTFKEEASVRRRFNQNGKNVDTSDTQVLAGAIRTLLAKDKG